MVRNWREPGPLPGELNQTMPVEPIELVGTEIHNAVEPDEVVFKPTREQRKARAMFYAVAKSRNMDTKNLTYDIISGIIPQYRQFAQWWHNDLFIDWFLNARSYRERIDYLIDMQLDNLEDIITNREGTFTAGDQVKAGRQLADFKKAFIDEGKADNRAADSADMVRAIAAQMVNARRLKSVPAKGADGDDPERPGNVDLPI